MFLFFLKDVALGLYSQLSYKRIIIYFLMQGDVMIVLLSCILVYQVKRWNRLVNK